MIYLLNTSEYKESLDLNNYATNIDELIKLAKYIVNKQYNLKKIIDVEVDLAAGIVKVQYKANSNSKIEYKILYIYSSVKI